MALKPSLLSSVLPVSNACALFFFRILRLVHVSLTAANGQATRVPVEATFAANNMITLLVMIILVGTL
jgi:hypothetical protein